MTRGVRNVAWQELVVSRVPVRGFFSSHPPPLLLRVAFRGPRTYRPGEWSTLILICPEGFLSFAFLHGQIFSPWLFLFGHLHSYAVGALLSTSWDCSSSVSRLGSYWQIAALRFSSGSPSSMAGSLRASSSTVLRGELSQPRSR